MCWQPLLLCVSQEAPSRKIWEIMNMKYPSTPENVPALSKALSNHLNRCFVDYPITILVQVFLFGLCWLPKINNVCKSLQSALQEPKQHRGIFQKRFQRVRWWVCSQNPPSPFSEYALEVSIPGKIYSKKHLISDFSAHHDSSIQVQMA